MLQSIADLFDNLLGLTLEASDLTWYPVAIRAAVVYVTVLAISRSGHKRFLGKGTAFDVIIGILLGSIASRAITGNAAFVPALVGCAVLVWLHAVFAWSAYRSPRFASLVEGQAVELVRNGKVIPDAMRQTDMTDEDLRESLRIGGVASLERVDAAYLERSGKISVVEKSS